VAVAGTPGQVDPWEVVNQPPLLLELDLYDSDVALKDGLRREGGGWDERGVREYARVMGSAEMV